MKKYYPALLILLVFVYMTTTGFQCGSAEATSAKLYMQQKQWQKAEESLLKEISKNDKNEDAWFLLGQVRLEMKKYDGMNEAYTKAMALGETHKMEITRNRLAIWAMNYNEGVAYYNKGRDTASYYDSALQCFATAISMEPDSSTTYYVAALASYAKKDFAGATQKLETALQKKPDYADAARFLGQLHYQEGIAKSEAKDEAGANAAFAKAGVAFETAYKLDPASPDNITNLIEIYERTKQIDKAMNLTRDAVTKDPKNKLYRYAYGVFLLKQEKFTESIEQFQEALKIDPTYGDANYNLGVAYLNWGVSMKEESDKKYEADRKANKGKDVKEDMSYKDRFKTALPYLEKSAESRTEDAALWQQLGKIYANLNMVDKSKAAFEKFDKLTKGK